jgi:hypothetical protein
MDDDPLDLAYKVAAILKAIVQMSDDVKNAQSPLDAQGKLLHMQNCIQKNAKRVAPYVQTIISLKEKATP